MHVIAPPLVSVVMPIHNAAAFLVEAVASVQAQSLANWELLAVDDGSTDGSGEMLAGLVATDPRIRTLSTGDNLGAGAARNCAMNAARGRFLAFLDADDLWHPEKLARQLDFLARHPAVLCFTGYVRRDLETGATEGVGVPETVSYRQLLTTNIIGCSTVVLDRAELGALRMPDLQLRQDYAFWLAILSKSGPALGVPLALTTYRCHGGQASGNKRRAARATWAMYRRHLRLPLVQSWFYFAHYALRGLMRHRAPGLARWLGWLTSPIFLGTPEAAQWAGQVGIPYPSQDHLQGKSD